MKFISTKRVVKNEVRSLKDELRSLKEEITKSENERQNTLVEFSKKSDVNLNQLDVKLSQLKESIANNKTDATKEFANLKCNFANLENKYEDIKNLLKKDDYPYLVFPQWVDHFNHTIKSLNIESSYKKLIKNLDEESIDKISKIVARALYLFNKRPEEVRDFLSSEEKIKIRDNRNSLFEHILHFGPNCHCFNGYFLPVNNFEESTFIENYGLDCISQDYLIDKDVIDAGAYVGDSSLVFERHLKSINKIYAFEPVFYSELKETVSMNESKKIIPINYALSDKKAHVELKGLGMGASISFNNDTLGLESVASSEAVPLDEFVSTNNLNVGLIKTDVEGHEMPLLKGALETIKKQKPTLIISIYHSAQDFFGIKSFIEDLNLGYKFKIFKANDGYVLTGTLLICEQR